MANAIFQDINCQIVKKCWELEECNFGTMAKETLYAMVAFTSPRDQQTSTQTTLKKRLV